MTEKQPKVMVLHDQPELYVDIIEDRFPGLETVLCKTSTEVPEILKTFKPEVVMSFRRIPPGPFPQEALTTSATIKWIHSGGAGSDHIVPWDPDHVTVTNSSGIHVAALSQYVIIQVLWFCAGMPRFQRQQREHRWERHPMDTVDGRTLLVVGMGNIGTGVAQRASALGMRVIGLRTASSESPYAEKVLAIENLDACLPEADFVALTLPRTDRARGLFGAARLARFKPGSILINIARGDIVDEAALIDALKDGPIAGAAMDVFSEEPLPTESPFWGMQNVIVTPHTGDPKDWERRAVEVFCDNLERYIKGEALINIVLPDRGY